MLVQLFQLYQKFANRKPLEDFTTEALVGVLNSDPIIKNQFCKKFLKLESERFQIFTQKKYGLENDRDCIVDIVILGNFNEEICFIENKIHAKEGYFQLGRYIKVLDKFYKEGRKTKLVFCTKFSEPKNYKTHKFQQIKWYNIAQFLKQFSENQLVVDFLNFLKFHEMNQDLTITSKDLIAIENFPRVLNMIRTYCDRVQQDFKDKFGSVSNETGINQFSHHVLEHNRIAFFTKSVLESNDAGYSEILYGFSFEGNICVQIYVYEGHRKYKEFKKEIQEKAKDNGFETEFYENGCRIYKKQNLGTYLNDEESDEKIEEWFKKTFKDFEDYMKSSELNWVKP